MSLKKIVFLDRDGTINIDYGYVSSVEKMELIAGAAQAIASFKQAGFMVVVVSNQSAIGRGYCYEADVAAVNEHMRELLLAEEPEALLDEIVYCPHDPSENCSCRKPEVGMLEEFNRKQEYFPGDCWMIGDKASDLAFAENLGIPFGQRILVLTGAGVEDLASLRSEENASEKAPVHCDSIVEAASLVLKV